MNHRETLTSILNKLHAMHAIGFVKITDIAKDICKPRQEVHEWIATRAHQPSGETAIKLRNCAGRWSNKMAMGGKEFQAGYRSAYDHACKLFPSTETES